ncbi:MAG: hypothetical protein J6Y89_03830 [Lachnospiraceae bacterium]|nr:hypothetical protein [Lachnospiraceae bacterium]
MNKFRRFLLPLLVLAMTLGLTACGYELRIDLSDLDKPVVSQINYYAEEELKSDTGAAERNKALESYEAGEITYESILEEYKNGYAEGRYEKKLDLKKATAEDLMKVIYPDSGSTVEEQLKEMYPDKKLEKAGEGLYKLENKFIKSTESDSRYSYIYADNGEETYLESQIIDASSKKAELFVFDNYKTSGSSTKSDLSSTYDSYSLTAKLPFKVYYTNGTKTSKKEVSFDKSFAKGEERCVAVASKKIYDVKKISAKIQTVEYDFENGEYKVISSKNAKNGKTYTVGTRLAVSSKNAIKVFTITVNDGQNENGGESVYNIAENSYTFDEPGKYKIKIVLANDTKKEFTIKIKEAKTEE